MKADTRPQWLIDLDVVKTTPEQARQIIKRQRALLKELKKAEPELLKKRVPTGWNKRYGHEAFIEISIGCPHCSHAKVVDDCRGCAWQKYHRADRISGCSAGEFDGLTHRIINETAPIYLTYGVTQASIAVLRPLRKYKIQEIRDCIADIRKFLKAHVTWGKDKIKRATRGSK